jgi:hypothetical protein
MTERVPIIVPTNGVRKDVANLIQTPDMMRNGTNVMVYDGTVRPRPGSNRVDVGGVVTLWKKTATSVRCWAAFGVYLIYQSTVDDKWYYSVDHGFEWFDITADVTGPSVVSRLAYCRDSEVLLAFDDQGDLWTVSVSSFPTPKTLAFTKIGSYLANYGSPGILYKTDPVFYDWVNDTLWWQARRNGGADQARVCALTNASAVTSGTYAANFLGGMAVQRPMSQHLIGANADEPFDHCWVRTPLSGGLTYQYTKLVPKDDGGTLTVSVDDWFFNDSFAYSVFTVPGFIGDSQTVAFLRGRGLYRFVYVSRAVNNVSWSTTKKLSPVSESAQYRLWQKSDTKEGFLAAQWCVVGADNVRTDDTGTTFEQYDDFPGIPNSLVEMQAYDDGSEYYFVSATNSLGGLELWFVNGQTGTGVQGDPLTGYGMSIFQGDLDTEPSGLYVGTEHRLLHFNFATDIWDDLSPQFTETEPPDPGDDLTYKIDGDLNTNRWVWRVTEKNGDKYIIATNGQIPPVAWMETLDEFRPVGDIDEDGIIDGDEVSAPLATCMALANNRLVLGKGLSVYLSAPQDFDLGYETEFKLADTYGNLVAMRELNAITIAILKTDAIYHGVSQVEFMGVSAPMRFELIKAGIVGPCSDASVVYLPDGRLCWLGRDGGVYIYDGAVPIDAGRHIRHAISPLLDTDRLGWAHGTVDTKRNLLWFFFPIKGLENYGMNNGIVMSIDQGNVWPTWFVQWPTEWEVMASMNVYTQTDMVYGDFPETTYLQLQELPYSAFQGGVWNFMILRKNLSAYTLDWSMANDNGVPVHVFMETGWYDFDDLYAFDTFHEMHHNVELDAQDELTWTLISEQSDGSELRQESVLQPSTARRRTTYRQTGRRHRFSMESDVASVFRWGGATGMYSRRGGR